MIVNAKFLVLYFPGVPIVSLWQRRLAASSLHFTFVPPGLLSWEMLISVPHKTETDLHSNLLYTMQLHLAVALFSKDNVCTE